MIQTNWQEKVGSQRNWYWRGWSIRYTYLHPVDRPIPDQAPMLMLHGFGASIGHWRNNLSYFATSRSVYALDLLGFGGSEKAVTKYQVSLWVAQVYEFWQTFINKPIVIVGNSIGSLVAIALAAKYPQAISQLVMISLPDPATRKEIIPKWLQPIVFSIENLFSSPLILRPIFYFVRRPNFIKKWAKVAYANPEAITAELVEILSSPAYDQHAARAFSSLFSAMSDPEFPGVKQVLPSLTIPILLIWGKEDRMIPPKFAQPKQFLQYNPKLQLIELENAGHCPHDECPDRVNQIIHEWMKHNQQ